ncbi:hypothetical protein DID88_000023 [Monilinia fructigena]|uniref:Uncharacterized protein n=1 Tax=Monilinia fructigena TaxID=38457 RepID=A0A395ILJ2_9HELO|nr:hypothetical protein DID88_000023 [Monilinia fructigena]
MRCNAPKADDRERGPYTREQSPHPLPFQAPEPHKVQHQFASGQSAGTPAFQAVITSWNNEREATLRRAALESYAKAVEAFVSQLSGRAKETCTGDPGGLAY